jgi:dTMP kinase
LTGMLIAIEGIDGSGKGTQAALLKDRLISAGFRTELLSFPRYRQTAFGHQIGCFLNGQFGSLDQVHPLLASLLFAGDRWESRSLILDAIARHDVVVCDRYVASNIAHQAAKRTGAERDALRDWIEQLEFGIYQLPRPSLTVWLDLPVAVARQLIEKKSRRTYTDKAADLQEADGDYLQQVREVYAELSARNPNWLRIDELLRGELRSIEEIAAEVFRAVAAAIPSSPVESPRSGPTFSDLAASRRAWLADVLQPWCRSAMRKDLLLAEQEWTDIAGHVDPEATLWRWAWSRFPALVHENLGIDETSEVIVRLTGGREIRGFPDNRQSKRGMLVVLTTDAHGHRADSGPFSIDDVSGIRRVHD